MLVGSGNHLFVTHRAARLDDGGGTCGNRREQTVSKGQEGFGGDGGALGERRRETERLGRFLGLDRSDAGGIDAAHLASADAGGLAVLGIDDRVRLDVFRHLEGELHVLEFLGRRRALGHDLELEIFDHAVVARLHQQTA
ncbi:hypothetical protein D9M70_490250 [compost metagenome]